jgi:catechol 2,3-dioxygenase-like lactoylglutathione lyase family enzyme
MHAIGIVWVGTRTPNFDATVRFFRDVLEMRLGRSRARDYARFDLPDGSFLEVLDAARPGLTHFSTGPVPGFLVDDFDRGRIELASQGYELIGDVGPRPGNRAPYRWQDFRAPDGCVYEIVEYPERPPPTEPSGAMAVTKVVWCGTSTERFEEVCRFYRETLQLTVIEQTEDLIECSFPDGGSLEAFRRGGPMDHLHFRTGPAPAFGVANIDRAMELLRARGVPLILTRRRDWGGWAHFRAPDGCIYEVKGFAPGHGPTGGV